MTAINALVRREDAHIISDAAGWDDCGIVREFHSKAWPLPKQLAVVATRGPLMAGLFLAARLDASAQTFDGIVERLADSFEGVCTEWFPNSSVYLHLVGYSTARAAFEFYFISNAQDLREHAEQEGTDRAVTPDAFTVTKLGIGAHNAPSVDLARGFDPPLRSVSEIVDVDHYARTVLELQREVKLGRDYGMDHDQHLVGGFGQITSITKAGITSRIICEWPDLIDEPIQPVPIDWNAWRKHKPALPALPEGLSRLQRQRFEKKLAKGKAI
jgi:hypothetical protein